MAVAHSNQSTVGWIRRFPAWLAGAKGPDDPASGGSGVDRQKAEPDDLPYHVELWDPQRRSIEQVLAVSSNGSIGYAAYYAATREYPGRYITLRHKNSIISRWNGPEN
ncbi:MAG TPA: hypothetical protein VFB13_15200 [Reyranella sp.]|jgi:hypothetical protein|nr:hypothetical protein [Reyranella sp.]